MGTRRLSALALGGLMGVGAMSLVGGQAAQATSGAVFRLGVLTVVGDHADDTLVISRDAAGQILVNGGALPIVGGVPTVANTRAILVVGNGGNDTLTLDEANGALPPATLLGGNGNDTITGGSGADLLAGLGGDDTLLGKGGADRLFGGTDDDTLTGGDADDQVFGEAGDDRMIWNPGDDTDLNEGGAGTDTTEVVGGNGNEVFSATANGARVRFDRLDPAPFAIDMGTTEDLVVNANGGDDSFSATGNLAALVRITVDGGAGNDTLLGSNGADLMIGGDGADFADGQQGNDVAFMGAGDDVFQWDPGDGSDVVEGQDGANDRMLFNGANVAEDFDVAANGGRVRFFRNVGNILMDLDDVEGIDLRAFGGADDLVVGDLSGTDVTDVATDLALNGGGDDAEPDTITVDATNGDDVLVANGTTGSFRLEGSQPVVTAVGASAATDVLLVNARDGDDVVEASGLAADAVRLVVDLGAGNDVGVGGPGDDTILGGDGDDVLLGGLGTDVLDGGAGDNVLIDGETVANGRVEGQAWLDEHAEVVGGETVLQTETLRAEIPTVALTATS